jgi:hypothetical protein
MVRYDTSEETRKRRAQRAHLANGEMAKPTDEFALVQRISGLFHATHSDHLLVHFEEAVFGDLDVKGRGIGVEGPERVLMEFDREWGRRILRY